MDTEVWSSTLRCRGVLARTNVGTGEAKGYTRNLIL